MQATNQPPSDRHSLWLKSVVISKSSPSDCGAQIAVMADPITADSNPTPPQTAGEGGLDPMVIGVVIVMAIYLLIIIKVKNI